MKEKKRSANWNIAATHYLTAGFAIPLVVNLIGGVILAVIIPEGIVLFVGLFLVGLLGVWLGVKYSAGYLRKKYIVTDKNKIANLTIIYFAVLVTIYFISQLLMGKFGGINIPFEIIRLATIGAVLYIASKKYITEDAQNTTDQIPTPVQ